MGATLTNKYGLPDTVYKACLYDNHKVAGDISVSQLIDSPRIRILKRHNDYTEDISERLYALMGTALHHIIERSNMDSLYHYSFVMTCDRLIQESKVVTSEEKKSSILKVVDWLTKMAKYLFPQLDNRYLQEVTQRIDIDGATLYGTPDNYDIRDEILYDYKFCSVYQYVYPEAREKWDAQTNVYAELLRQNGYNVKEIRIVAFFRDWNSNNIQRSKDYPPRQIMEIPVKVIDSPTMVNYIGKRINMHMSASTENLPLCTGKERWASSDSFAVKTPKSKKAVRVFERREQAEEFMLQNSRNYKGMFIEARPGVSRRCESYCQMKEICSQYSDELRIRQQLIDEL